METKRVAIALSGGIDSAAVAMMLIEQGFDCFGISMKLFNSKNKKLHDSESDDISRAGKIAGRLGIRHYVVDLSREFYEIVVNDFIESYANGYTPNPCVVCNEYIKFGLLLDKAIELGADLMATGHYARVCQNHLNDKYELYRGRASKKDQGYPLHRLSQKELSRLIFPLGELNSKDRVYDLVRKSELSHIFDGYNNESMGICFAPNNGYTQIFKNMAPQIVKEGAIVNIDGKIIGRHKGTAYYTIGQRKGINKGINKEKINLQNENIRDNKIKCKDVMKKSSYINEYRKNNVVLSIDARKNQIMVGEEIYLYKNKIYLEDVKCICSDIDDIMGEYLTWKHCHWGIEFIGQLLNDNDKLFIKCVDAQRAPTNGQYAVAYDGDKIIGGGRIVGSE